MDLGIMRTRITDKFIELIPDEGKFIANSEMTEVYEGNIYLSLLDSTDNYVEIDEEQANAINVETE